MNIYGTPHFCGAFLGQFVEWDPWDVCCHKSHAKTGPAKKERRNNRSIWWNYTPETMVVMRVREMYNSRGTVHTLSQYKNTENLYTIDTLA